MHARGRSSGRTAEAECQFIPTGTLSPRVSAACRRAVPLAASAASPVMYSGGPISLQKQTVSVAVASGPAPAES